jgi:ribosomal protein S18 acetylase RimI-like enzyme
MEISITPSFSPLDTDRFGVRTARQNRLTAANLDASLEYCRTEQISFLIARVPASDLESVHLAEQAGFRLMDTLVYYSYDLHKPPVVSQAGAVQIEPFQPGLEEAVAQVAREAFSGYMGHYHADPRLDRQACDEAYVSWAYRSCTVHGVADCVLTAVASAEPEAPGQVIGFVTLKQGQPGEWEIPLNAVLPAWQRMGIYRALLLAAIRFCCEQGGRSLLISTQLTNLAPQKTWVRLGFEPYSAEYTFHKWAGDV